MAKGRPIKEGKEPRVAVNIKVPLKAKALLPKLQDPDKLIDSDTAVIVALIYAEAKRQGKTVTPEEIEAIKPQAKKAAAPKKG